MTHAPRKLLGLLAAGVVGVAGAPAAGAQEGAGDFGDIEIPALVLDDGEVSAGSDGSDIDLANVVQSAARSVTTVQEAPAIVTVITEEEIADRHTQTITELLEAAVPGYIRTGMYHSMFPIPLPRGQVQSVLFLHDSTSLFDPFLNLATTTPVQPIELIKRVEVITGPGGVLWGANSLLGIVNVITKDAEDVDGVEVGLTGGHGNGNREYLHGYVMAGKTELAGNDDAKLFVHGSFKTYKGPGFTMPAMIFSVPLPQPNAPILYGPLTQADPPMSFLFTAFGKLTWGKTQLRVWAPFYERQQPLTFRGTVIREDLPQDDRCADADPAALGDGCDDAARLARDNQPRFFDRYAVLEHRTRMAGGRAGISAKAYMMQFNRDFPQLAVLPGIDGLIEGGIAVKFDATTYRPGMSIDGDVELPGRARLLYGLEAFRDIVPRDVTRSRQGDGLEASFNAPINLERVPQPCPRELDPNNPGQVRIMPGCPVTFAFPGGRTVLGAYVAPQWRPTKKLILDLGGRIQVAPEQFSLNPYDPTFTVAASAVYNFLPDWYAKANYSQGFRPPVFNNLVSNGEAVQLDGRPDLVVETADSVQGEVNARLFKGDRRVRELSFRLDYSYTRIQNLIQISGGRYENTSDRSINSVEFLGKLYIEGGHRLELGYTWLRVDTADRGVFRMMPENWFNLTGVFNVIDDKLRATTHLRVLGAHEDSNRMVEHRFLRYCGAEDMATLGCLPGDVVSDLDPTARSLRTMPFELVMDRLPPTAELMLGVTYLATQNLTLNFEVFNAMNARSYQPDLFGDYDPRLEFLPNPYEDLRAYLGASYNY